MGNYYNAIVRNQRGSALLEGLVAILIFSLGLLGLVGFQVAAIKAQGEARARVDAAFVANQMVGEMWALAPSQLSSCAGSYDSNTSSCNNVPWGERIRQSLPNGSAVVAINGSQVTITLTWQTPGVNEEHRYVHAANIARN